MDTQEITWDGKENITVALLGLKRKTIAQPIGLIHYVGESQGFSCQVVHPTQCGTSNIATLFKDWCLRRLHSIDIDPAVASFCLGGLLSSFLCPTLNKKANCQLKRLVHYVEKPYGLSIKQLILLTIILLS